MEDKKRNYSSVIIVLIFIFVWWAFATDAKEKREALIISAVEKVCEQTFENFDCLGMGYDVAREYERQAKDSEDRE